MYRINPIIIELLKKRGISEEKDVQEFLSEKPQKTYDPFLLTDMEAGVDLILSKIERGEKICIYGDYDADGITSISLLYEVLMHLTDKICYYIPSRFEEGYGLNKEAIKKIKDDGAGLIVTVDCGTVSYDEVEYAKQIGMNIMVTDHHSVNERMADCILINPKRPGSHYPCQHLAGVGVAFKLAQALQQKAGLPKSVLTSVLDLVAIGTIGDIVPLVDENRTVSKYGVKKINESKRKGLTKLIEGIRLTPGAVTSDNVAFAIVPHLNAAGRMMDAKVAVELMISHDDVVIDKCVQRLIENNNERKNVQSVTYDECMMQVEEKYKDDNIIIIYSDDIHEGIAGIVAGKLKDKYNRPIIIVTPSGEDGMYLKGTGRSIEKINLYNLLNTCDDLFEKFGGHSGACGFLLKKERFEELKERLAAAVDEMIEADAKLLEFEMIADLEVSANLIDAELCDMIYKMQPFGNQNPKPIFMLSDIKPMYISRMGKNEQHMRFTAVDNYGGRLACVVFNKADEYVDLLDSGEKIRIYGTAEKQIWNGIQRIQMYVSHIEKMN